MKTIFKIFWGEGAGLKYIFFCFHWIIKKEEFISCASHLVKQNKQKKCNINH